MTEQQQLLAMLSRAGIGHGTHPDYHGGAVSGACVQVESEEPDESGDWWVTCFKFNAAGNLTEVVTNPGEEG